MRVAVTINGTGYTADVPPATLLVAFIRDVAGLPGTKVGCDTTTCGSCTVLLDGESVKSCTVLAAQADGSEVTTIEGLAAGDEPHPVQRAFAACHAVQCGFCTPGMVLAAAGVIAEARADGTVLDEPAVRRALIGNLCRCTGYHNIVRAVLAADRATTCPLSREGEDR